MPEERSNKEMFVWTKNWRMGFKNLIPSLTSSIDSCLFETNIEYKIIKLISIELK